MRRTGALWNRIVSFENVLAASRNAQRGKRYREDVLRFTLDLESNLHVLLEELRDKSYVPGPYKTFVIYEPKRRLISAAPYRDRVVHHALCNIIEPIFDRGFLDSCYANRKGKGSHKALDHFVSLTRRRRLCLRADIEKYFPSIDHAVLKAAIRRKIKCRDTLWLIDLILDHSNTQEPVGLWFEGDNLLTPAERRHGLPIGNLTSQLWANVYLDRVDHTMAERYGGSRYLRFVDDFALFSDSQEELAEARACLTEQLSALRLRLHPAKTRVFAVAEGVNFLGFRIFPDRIRLRSENLRRACRRMRMLQWQYAHGAMQWSDVRQSLESWNAHAAYGDTWRLRERVFKRLVFTRN